MFVHVGAALMKIINYISGNKVTKVTQNYLKK